MRRALKQFEAGLVEEVTGLLDRYPDQPTALQAIGYKEVARHVLGHNTRDEAVEQVVSATVRYAKRQRTWFRHQLAGAVVEWLDPLADDANRRLEAWWHDTPATRLRATPAGGEEGT